MKQKRQRPRTYTDTDLDALQAQDTAELDALINEHAAEIDALMAQLQADDPTARLLAELDGTRKRWQHSIPKIPKRMPRIKRTV